MSIRWAGDRVVVEPFKHSETKSGILIPEKAETKMRTGRVIGVGSKVKGIKPGDIIYFLRWVGNPISVGNIEAIYFSSYHAIGFPI